MTLTFNLPQHLDVVFEYLSDMQKFQAVHPIIYRIDQLDLHRYRVFEKLVVCYLPFTISYVAKLTTNKAAGSVRITAMVKKMVHATMDCTISPSGRGSLVTEKITFPSVFALTGIMNAIFRKNHTLLFKNIQKNAI